MNDPTSIGPRFAACIGQVIRERKIRVTLETGAYDGSGSTAAIVEALGGGQFPQSLHYAIEINPARASACAARYTGKNVMVMCGLSVPRKSLPSMEALERAIVERLPDDVVIDWPGEPASTIARSYAEEIGDPVEDDMLLRAFRPRSALNPQFVLLDSAGHLGEIEFDRVMGLVGDTPIVLAMDDTRHFKHWHTARRIAFDGRWHVIARDNAERNGWLIAEFNP